MKEQRFRELLNAYLQDSLSSAELEELIKAAPEKFIGLLEESLDASFLNKDFAGLGDPAHADLIFGRILQAAPRRQKAKIILLKRIVAAACLAGLLITGFYLFYGKRSSTRQEMAASTSSDITAPVVSRAMITLEDGRQISLDSIGSGLLAEQGELKLIKKNEAELSYTGTPSKGTGGFHTLANPRGSAVITLSLPDGTRVWINSATTIRYFSTLQNDQRLVELDGEAYFEVSPDKSKPFIVKDSRRQSTVQVLGTNFNVNNYPDEPATEATLLEGSIRMSSDANAGSTAVVLRPGEQGQVSNGSLQITKQADLEEVMAWKNGLFSFNKADIQTILRQVGRWYDVDVSFEGAIPTRRFIGKVSRQSKISEVLKILELSNIHFRIEGKKLIVVP